jgi:hypothetical protein
MEKFGLLVNNNKYATFKDVSDFLYPADRIEEYDIREFSLTANTAFNMALTGLASPLQVDEFFFYSPNAANNRTIRVTFKNAQNKGLLDATFPSNIAVPNIPKVILREGDVITFLSQVAVETVRLQLKRVAVTALITPTTTT